MGHQEEDLAFVKPESEEDEDLELLQEVLSESIPRLEDESIQAVEEEFIQAAEEDEDYLDLDMLQEVLHESTPSNSSSASGEESREDPLGLIPLLLEMQVEVVKQMKKDFRFVVDLMDSLRNNPNFKPLFQALQRMGLTVSDMLWRYLPS